MIFPHSPPPPLFKRFNPHFLCKSPPLLSFCVTLRQNWMSDVCSFPHTFAPGRFLSKSAPALDSILMATFSQKKNKLPGSTYFLFFNDKVSAGFSTTSFGTEVRQGPLHFPRRNDQSPPLQLSHLIAVRFQKVHGEVAGFCFSPYFHQPVIPDVVLAFLFTLVPHLTFRSFRHLISLSFFTKGKFFPGSFATSLVCVGVIIQFLLC